jgi:serine/threonine-protein phosphatase 6 regulatory ankyrin repeat subunit B
VAELFLTEGAPVNNKTDRGDSALLLASKNGHLEVVQTLIRQGADVNIQSISTGNTPLIVALANGHVSVAEEILKGAVDPNMTTNSGATALMVAVQAGLENIVRTLIDKGANVAAKTPGGVEALDLCQGGPILRLLAMSRKGS